MANRRLSMRKIKEVLRLTHQGKLSERQVAQSLNLSRSTVKDYRGRAHRAGLSWPLPESLSEQALEQKLFPHHSGWRVSEMRALEWRDVDSAGKVVRLRPEISKNKDGRVLPLHGELIDVIERARARRVVGCPFVFHLNAKPIGDFRKSWRKTCKEAKLGGLIVHDLRRTAVQNLVRAGVSERVAMQLTGHKTRSVFDRYDVVNEDDLQRASEKLQAHLTRQPKNRAVTPLHDNRKSA